MFETSEVCLADDCQVVSIQITGTQREQWTEDRTWNVSISREDNDNCNVSCKEVQGNSRHTNIIYTKMWCDQIDIGCQNFQGTSLWKAAMSLNMQQHKICKQGKLVHHLSVLVETSSLVFHRCEETILRSFTWSLHRQRNLKMRSCWVGSPAEVSEAFESTLKLQSLSSLSHDVADPDSLIYDLNVSFDTAKKGEWTMPHFPQGFAKRESRSTKPCTHPWVWACVCEYEHMLMCV